VGNLQLHWRGLVFVASSICSAGDTRTARRLGLANVITANVNRPRLRWMFFDWSISPTPIVENVGWHRTGWGHFLIWLFNILISVLLNFYYGLLIERHLWLIGHKWQGSGSTTNTLCFGLYSQNEAPFLADSNLIRARQFMFKGKK